MEEKRVCTSTSLHRVSEILIEWSQNPEWTPTQASKHFGVPKGTLLGWRTKYSDPKLGHVNVPTDVGDRRRQEGAGRKHKLPSWAWPILEYLWDRLDANEIVTREDVFKKCLQVPEFALMPDNSQRPWVSRFLQRYGSSSESRGNNRTRKAGDPPDGDRGTDISVVDTAAISLSTSSQLGKKRKQENIQAKGTSTKSSKSAPGPVILHRSSKSAPGPVILHQPSKSAPGPVILHQSSKSAPGPVILHQSSKSAPGLHQSSPTTTTQVALNPKPTHKKGRPSKSQSTRSQTKKSELKASDSDSDFILSDTSSSCEEKQRPSVRWNLRKQKAPNNRESIVSLAHRNIHGELQTLFLYREDIDSLNPRQPVTSPMIDFLIAKFFPKEVTAFGTSFFHSVERAYKSKSHAIMEEVVGNLDWKQHPFVFFPVGGLSHWSLIVIENAISSPTVHHVDSMKGIHQAAYIFELLQWFIRESTKSSLDGMHPAGIRTLSYPTTPQQSNNFDCGIYMLHYMWKIQRYVVDRQQKTLVDHMESILKSSFNAASAERSRASIRKQVLEMAEHT